MFTIKEPFYECSSKHIARYHTLRDRFDALDSSLRVLIEAVTQVKNEFRTLQASLESINLLESVDESQNALEQSQTFLEAINSLPISELTDQLKSAKAKRNVIKNIINERKNLNFQKFTSVEDLMTRIKGLAQHSLEKIMRQWS